jgi:hypothetical protein
MGEIINLNKARKARAKAEADAQAKTNRATFGRTKGQKKKETIDKERAAKLLDASKREKDEPK